MNDRVLEVLLIEDNPGDVRLITEAMSHGKTAVHVNAIGDGVAAMEFLHRQGQYSSAPRPDLIILDLNLPRKDGREVLAEIKRDESFRCIPIVVLSASEAPEDIFLTYDLSANCYINKPVDMDQFVQAVLTTENFWMQIAHLPVTQ